jgi:hypothetical protein
VTRALTLSLALLCLAALALGACGGDEPSAPDSVPAAGENTPPSGTPGVPDAAPYNLDGTEWANLSDSRRLDAAQAYIDDNASRCEGASPDDVAAYVSASYGFDFPPDIPAASVLAEGCDAALQS